PRNGSAFGAVGTSPNVGRKPTMLLKLPGFRSEPPLSLPSAIGSMPLASDAAAPPLEPPALLVRSYGFRVGPYTLLTVCEPMPNSGTFVLPIGITPAARIRSTNTESSVGIASLYTSEPRVNGNPTADCRSLNAVGRPCSGGSGAPVAARASASSANARQ